MAGNYKETCHNLNDKI